MAGPRRDSVERTLSLETPGTVLITGVSGQVGLAVAQRLTAIAPHVSVATPTRAELDLQNPASIRAYVQRVMPRWIVSCAAYTAVDAAEGDRETAFAVNGVAPGVLAEAAAACAAGLIHLSTDYVFDGGGTRPWIETDATGPRNVYGASKLAGEAAIAAVVADTGMPYVILRTSWVYSAGGKNFVRTMLRLLSTRTEPLRIVADQHGAPTSAADLATAIMGIFQCAERQADGAPLASSFGECSGLYHCAGTGETTWAGLANVVREYLLQRGFQAPEIIPVPTSAYPTTAVRPLNSRLNCGKLAANFGIRLPLWTDSVAEALHQLAATDLPTD
jgi:dTDP-4-dehydrorhamnose reductase